MMQAIFLHGTKKYDVRFHVCNHVPTKTNSGRLIGVRPKNLLQRSLDRKNMLGLKKMIRLDDTKNGGGTTDLGGEILDNELKILSPRGVLITRRPQQKNPS
jgi:hypothetical protein